MATDFDYEQCKRLGHQMDDLSGPPLNVSPPELRGLEYNFWLRCLRCETVRLVVKSGTTGQTTYSRYIYPVGYSWSGKKGEAPRRSDYWLWEIKQRQK